jgi:hypothetical protein
VAGSALSVFRRPAAVSFGGIVESRELAFIALRVLSSWTHGEAPKSADMSILRADALPDEADLPLDELACRIIRRTCARVIEESQADRKGIELDLHRAEVA